MYIESFKDDKKKSIKIYSSALSELFFLSIYLMCLFFRLSVFFKEKNFLFLYYQIFAVFFMFGDHPWGGGELLIRLIHQLTMNQVLFIVIDSKTVLGVLNIASEDEKKKIQSNKTKQKQE